MRKWMPWVGRFLTVCCALLAGCGSAPSGGTLPAATATSTLIPPQPTSTTMVSTTITFACPTTTNGDIKVFSDSTYGSYSFSYPASWTENHCQLDTTTTTIGNLFKVSVWSRNGKSIQEWVAGEKTPNETVALTPLQVRHADDAVRVTDTLAPGISKGAFFQAAAIIAGSQDFYVITILIVQANMTDTVPTEPITTILATFDAQR